MRWVTNRSFTNRWMCVEIASLVGKMNVVVCLRSQTTDIIANHDRIIRVKTGKKCNIEMRCFLFFVR